MSLTQGLAGPRAISRRRPVALVTIVLSGLVISFFSGAAIAQERSSIPAGQAPAGTEANGAPPASSDETASSTSLDQTVPPQQQTERRPPLELRGSLALEETYTTNAFGAFTGGGSPPDTYTRAMLNLGIRYTTRRSQLFANYTFWGDYYSKYHILNDYVNNLNLASATQLIPDHLTLNITGFASPIVTNRAGVVSAGGELLSSSNISNTYGYVVQPEYRMRLSDIATSVTDVDQSGVYFVFPGTANPIGPSPTNIANGVMVGATQRFVSGEYFGRLHWIITGDFSKLKEQSFSQIDKDGSVDLSYAIDRSFQLLATTGYNDLAVNVPLTRPLSGPEYMGGFAYTPSPSLRFTAEAGERNRTPTYIGSVTWQLSPLTSLNGLLTDGITTPQGSILSGLSGFGDALLNPGTVTSPFSPLGGITPSENAALGSVSPLLSQGLAIDNFLYHYRHAMVTLAHTMERTSISLSFFEERRTQVQLIPGIDNSSSLYGITATASRRIHTDIDGFLSLSYSNADEFGGHDQFFQGNIGANFALSETLTLYAMNRYFYRESSYPPPVTAGRTTIEEVAVGIRRSF